ncbi:MAG: hypothetical protein WEE89_20125 [Gemmatimonadota bacterium]
MGIFSRIRERRLFQIVASYLAAGWIALEVMDQLVDRGRLPEVMYEIILIGYVCGIPAALLVGWYHGEKGVQKAPRSEIAMLSMLTVLMLVLSSFSVSSYRDERFRMKAAQDAAGLELHKIGVLYFEDYTPNGQYKHVADAFTEALIDELSRVPGLTVTSRNAAARFAGSELPPDSIAHMLGVGTLVGGIVETRRDGLRVTIRLFEGGEGNEFKSTRIETTPEDLLAARDRGVEDVARLLRQFVGQEVRIRAGGMRLTNGEAWTLYQRAEKVRKDAEALARDHDVKAAHTTFTRADSLLKHVQVLAPEWPDPGILQANMAYRRSRQLSARPEVLEWADRAIAYADNAIALAPNDARALEIRGTSKYWKYLQLQGSDPEQSKRLFAEARRDLEESVRIDPRAAGAHSVLSHLLTREDLSSALLAARQAYEADAYLEAAPDILLRLVTGNYDLENFDQMQRWCTEGGRRMPTNFRFTDCQLLLLTTRQMEPDVERGWQLLAQLDSLSPENRRAYDHVRGLAMVGGIAARANMPDSARHVLAKALNQLTHETDPRQEILPLIAYMYTLAGDNRTAIGLLRRYSAVTPTASFEHHWRWRELRGLPEFQPLLAEQH